jgi:ATP-dependent DNA helicase RecQ
LEGFALIEKVELAALKQAREALKTYFGYETFRRGQEEVIAEILAGRDVLGVMPTGAGKSICYQLPAAILGGVTLVISPLISLMKDQVDALNQMGVAAALINSTLTAGELNERFREIENGRYRIVYVAPERLESGRFAELVERLHVPLVAVDEAHCVSQWGHDFRPSYMAIRSWLERIQPRPVLAAFTATATEKVKQDIVAQLRLRRPFMLTTGYARENLRFSVVQGVDKGRFLLHFLKGQEGNSGIVYAATRKEVEACQRFLQRSGYKAGRYHAGLSDEERARSQELFLYDDIQIMVATNAFGMGIDKSNVRFVVHYSMPRNIESYYQEAGRAGRDGEPSECVLLYAAQDVMTQKFLIGQSEADEARKAQEYGNLQEMIRYCHTTDCLQHYIVRYFGDADERECGQCGNCTDERETTDITVDAQKIFSCIVRMKQRFGLSLTAKVLRGAGDSKIKQFGFDKLPTYGVMRGVKEKDIMMMMNVLVADGFLRISDSQFPTVSLTERAKAVLQGEERVLQRVVLLREKAAGEGDGSWNAVLFDQLRGLRKQFSEREKVPPFTIFHDATLRDMSRMFPRSERELLRIKGVGQSKLEKYGEDFLRCIAEFAEANPEAMAEMEAGVTGREFGVGNEWESGLAGEVRLSVGRSSSERASYLLTLDMFRDGMEVGEIASARRMSKVTIEDHLVRCADEGEDLDWTRVIPDGQESLVLDAIAAAGAEKLRSIKDALPEEIGYFTIKAVLAKHGLKR